MIYPLPSDTPHNPHWNLQKIILVILVCCLICKNVSRSNMIYTSASIFCWGRQAPLYREPLQVSEMRKIDLHLVRHLGWDVAPGATLYHRRDGKLTFAAGSGIRSDISTFSGLLRRRGRLSWCRCEASMYTLSGDWRDCTTAGHELDRMTGKHVQ